jgi:hypothetical protein
VKVLRSLLVAAGVFATVAAIVGALVAAFTDGPSYGSAIAWSMWIVGSLAVLLVGQSGSTTRSSGISRVVVGGRFAEGSELAQPQSPFVLVPAGLLVVALGVLVYVYAG